MMDPKAIPGVLDGVATALTKAGLHSTTDLNRVRVPGCFVALDTLDAPVMARGYVEGTYCVHLTARDTGGRRALDVLAAGLATVMDTVDSVPTRLELTTIQVPAYEVGLPAITCTFNL